MTLRLATFLLALTLLIAAAVSLTGFLVSRVQASSAVLYSAEFTNGPEGWYTTYSENGYAGPRTWTAPLEWNSGGYVRSWSLYPHTWWPDGNQACGSPFVSTTWDAPCRNWLVMLGFVRTEAMPQDWTGAKVEIRSRAPTGIAYADQQMFLWLQATRIVNGQTKASNYIVARHPIPLRPYWSTTSFRLEAEDMVCAGSISLRADFYDCGLSAAQVLANINADFILVLEPVNPRLYPIGEVDLDHFQVVR